MCLLIVSVQVFAEKMGLETGWNCHISLTPNGDSPCDGAPSSPSHGSLHEDLNQGTLPLLTCLMSGVWSYREYLTAPFICDTDSRDEAEGPLLPEEEVHSDLASFQPTDSDVPSFLEDCNRVTIPFIKTSEATAHFSLYMEKVSLSTVIPTKHNYFCLFLS